MIRLKKLHLFILIAIFSLVFFMIQLMFNIKISINHYQHDKYMKNNPVLSNVLVNKQKLGEGSQFESKNVKKIFKKVMKNELVIPLDSNKQPFLYHMLPFFHRKDYANFSHALVETLVLVENFPKLINVTELSFINIEEENRIKNMAILKDSDFVQLPVNDFKNNEDFKYIRGVKKDKLHLYRPDSSGLFKCIDSNQRIPFTNLNDEYCDCVDGTDEPGTSACQFSIFYCETQNEFLIDNYIPSSRVDDKICDCCDGSDESEPVKCKNKCDEQMALLQKNFYENKKALAEKEKYIIHGLFNNDKQYGPRGVFYKLSKKCFKINWSEFDFEVCPYKKCIQSKNGASTNIGSKPALILSENQKKHKWILKMSDGDGNFCQKPRESYIHFKCHHQDILKKVEEPEKCVYKFTLLTPAAC